MTEDRNIGEIQHVDEPDRTVAEMLADDGYDLKTGINKDGDDILWVEPQHPPRKSHWEEVVDLQDEMIRFQRSPAGRSWGYAFGDSILNSDDHRMRGITTQDLRHGEVHWTHGIPELCFSMLTIADPIYINEDMHQLIAAAAETWEEERLHIEDVYPTLTGFAVFPKPFIARDTHGKRISFRALCWTPVDNDGRAQDPFAPPIPIQQVAGILLTAWTYEGDPDDYPFPVGSVGAPVPKLTLSYITPWHFANDTRPEDIGGTGLNDMLTVAQVMWRLARQEISTNTTTQLPRAARKRAERAKLESDVVVITLRRIKAKLGADHEPAAVDWSCRWAVRGHWRNQWYPKLREHRQIWIAPYIKGPEDAPLKVAPLRAYDLTR